MCYKLVQQVHVCSQHQQPCMLMSLFPPCPFCETPAAWKLVPMGFTTAAIVAEQRAELIKVTSGCKELDDILEGTRALLH